MDFIKPTVQVTKINELPRMYESWTDFYFWWSPWVYSTGDKNLSVTDYGTGVVTEYRINWSFVLRKAAEEKSACKSPLPDLYAFRIFRWMKKQWEMVG